MNNQAQIDSRINNSNFDNLSINNNKKLNLPPNSNIPLDRIQLTNLSPATVQQLVDASQFLYNGGSQLTTYLPYLQLQPNLMLHQIPRSSPLVVPNSHHSAPFSTTIPMNNNYQINHDNNSRNYENTNKYLTRNMSNLENVLEGISELTLNNNRNGTIIPNQFNYGSMNLSDDLQKTNVTNNITPGNTVSAITTSPSSCNNDLDYSCFYNPDITNSLPGRNNLDTNFGGTNDPNFLNTGTFMEMVRIAMRGSELAEHIAHLHRHRPCFKKIDSLCARIKQDVQRFDNVLSNINSQGTAWAIKDFIFMYTRTLNAWIIGRGYVYNSSEGLTKIKNSLSPNFSKSFLQWEKSTVDFIQELVKSFISLNQLTQTQKMYQKAENNGNNNPVTSTPTHKFEDLFNNFDINRPDFSIFDASLDTLLMNNSCSSNNNSFNDNSNGSTDHTSSKNTSNNNSPNKNTKMNIPNPCDYHEDDEDDVNEVETEKLKNNSQYIKTGVYNPVPRDILGFNFSQKDLLNTAKDVGSYSNNFNSTNANDPPFFNNTDKLNSSKVVDTEDNEGESKTICSKLLTTEATVSNNCMPTPPSSSSLSSSPSSSSSSSLPINPSQTQLPIFKSNASLPPQPPVPFSNENVHDPKSFISPNQTKSSNHFDLPLNNNIDHKIQLSQNNIGKLLQSINKQNSRSSERFNGGNSRSIKHHELLLNRVLEFPEVNYFFNSVFTKNYFPEFMSKYPCYVDVRSIVLKSNAGGYYHIYEVVHDLKMIIYNARMYLEKNIDDTLGYIILHYEVKLNATLNDNDFRGYYFDHITGDPNEDLRIYEE